MNRNVRGYQQNGKVFHDYGQRKRDRIVINIGDVESWGWAALILSLMVAMAYFITEWVIV